MTSMESIVKLSDVIGALAELDGADIGLIRLDGDKAEIMTHSGIERSGRSLTVENGNSYFTVRYQTRGVSVFELKFNEDEGGQNNDPV